MLILLNLNWTRKHPIILQWHNIFCVCCHASNPDAWNNPIYLWAIGCGAFSRCALQFWVPNLQATSTLLPCWKTQKIQLYFDLFCYADAWWAVNILSPQVCITVQIWMIKLWSNPMTEFESVSEYRSNIIVPGLCVWVPPYSEENTNQLGEGRNFAMWILSQSDNVMCWTVFDWDRIIACTRKFWD